MAGSPVKNRPRIFETSGGPPNGAASPISFDDDLGLNREICPFESSSEHLDVEIAAKQKQNPASLFHES